MAQVFYHSTKPDNCRKLIQEKNQDLFV